MRLERKKSSKRSARGYLDGQMLIAMPMVHEGHFARSLIYVCAHSTEGATTPEAARTVHGLGFCQCAVETCAWCRQPGAAGE